MSSLNSTDGDNTPIHVVAETDSICAPCPSRREHLCATQEKIDVLDHAHAAALNIKAGDVLTWKEAKEKIAANISLDTFHEICATCEWKQYGICEGVVRDLQSQKN